jgi:HPt (histidine-containing phosphotransfer) domain-containing protein
MVVAGGLTDGLSPSASAQFAALRRRYVEGLASRWTEIATAGDRQTLLAALHRLAGSAASFGFERLGQCARDAEARVAQGNATALAAALDELQTEIVRIA